MSKKNNKKSIKKFNHNAYKIESLEPRVMMDADASQWLEEIDSIALSDTAVTALGDDNFYSRTIGTVRVMLRGFICKMKNPGKGIDAGSAERVGYIPRPGSSARPY